MYFNDLPKKFFYPWCLSLQFISFAMLIYSFYCVYSKSYSISMVKLLEYIPIVTCFSLKVISSYSFTSVSPLFAALCRCELFGCLKAIRTK